MDNIIQVTNLKKYFKEVKAVDGISFRVEKGQLYGFLGVNGAGKSTTINMLCTLLQKDSGDVTVCGYSLDKENHEIRRKIGVVFQDNSLDERLTIKENLTIRASLYEKSSTTVKRKMYEISEILNIHDLLNRQFCKLSGGQKRRCEIAKALMNTPEILFLDEPTTGLDPQTRQNVWDSVEKLRKDMNMTVFLTTHYMEEAAKAQYIAIMEAGKIVAQGSPFDLKAQYANDLLRLVPKDKEKLLLNLEQQEYHFDIRSNHIRVYLPGTMDSLDLLNQIRDQITAFEVVQGAMDDVFLNVTGKSL
ncbi:MAG: transporter ATP-binding protein [Herbinix sp.]|jgi:multidrug/hemolysin transport system ATP-binding protein|nr:transporter ATP-binding protein [Herbinix sp.]